MTFTGRQGQFWGGAQVGVKAGLLPPVPSPSLVMSSYPHTQQFHAG